MKCEWSNTALAVILAMIISFIPVPSADACPGCFLDGDAFTLCHSHALSIAVAVITAREHGLMAPPDPPGRQRPIEFELDRFADSIFNFGGQAPVAHTAGVDVVLVDGPAHYRIEKLPGLTRVSKQADPRHRSSSTLLVTATPVIRAIARGELSITMAIELGVLEVEGQWSELIRRRLSGGIVALTINAASLPLARPVPFRHSEDK